MLIEFTVKNYASFKERTTLSAETGNRLRKLKETNTFSSKNPSLLKSLLLFGPNGSGKSQLIQALQTMEGIVTRPTQAVTDKLNYYPFLFDEKSKIEDTYFEVKLELKNKIYDYSFSYNRESITSEALTLISGNKEKEIFSRNGNDIQISNKLLEDSIPKLRDNSLFLYLAQSENDADCIAIYKWFANDLIFIGSGYPLSIPDELLNLMEDEYLKKEMISFLSFADFNISDIRIREIPTNPLNPQLQKIVENLSIDYPKTTKELYTVHKIYHQNKVINSGELPLTQESVGTRRVFYIFFWLIVGQMFGYENTKVFVEFFY